MASELITECTMTTLKESEKLYPARSVDALLQREREAAIERENNIKALIKDTDDTFDNMCQAIGLIAELGDLPPNVYTTNELYARVNTLTSALKSLYEALLGTSSEETPSS